MGKRIAEISVLRRGGPALVAAGLAVAVLAGAGPATAAAHPRSLAAPGAPRAGPAGVISTVAGGVGGPGRATGVAMSPCGVAFGGGHLYIGTHSAVREVSPNSDWLTTPAGTGLTRPIESSGRIATRTSLNGACGVGLDRSGNLVIADANKQRILVVAATTGTFYGQAMTARHIYTVAGDGIFGSSGDGGPATSAQLGEPSGVAVDGAGNLVIADTDNYRVRVVAARSGRFYGQAMTAGDIYTVAGGGNGGLGDGGPATSAELAHPESVAVDGAGNLVIADTDNYRVRVVAARSGRFYGQAMTAGDIYTVAGDGIFGFSGDGGPATSAELAHPDSVAVDGAGNLVIADTDNQRVRVVAARSGRFYGQAMTAGDIYTVAGTGTEGVSGDGGPATSAELTLPDSVAVDGAGNLVIADIGSRVRVVAARSGRFYGRVMTAGDIYTVAGTASGAFVSGELNDTGGFSGDGGRATRAELSFPSQVAVDGAGNRLIADSDNSRVRVVAARTGTLYGQAMIAGHIYTVAGTGTEGFSGDGGRATRAELSFPSGVAVDGADNLLIADTNNERVRVVAASTGTFYGQAMTVGDIYTVAGTGTQGFSGDGGPATSAELNLPAGVAVDGAGNLVIADTHNLRVRVVAAGTGTFYGQAMSAGDIYTVADTGKHGASGDHDHIYGPSGVAVDGAGNLIIADSRNARVRVVAASTGIFYGQAMSVGGIYTVAGTGIAGFSGDGGPATSAELDGPSEVAVDGAGNLVIADTLNSRVRVVAAGTGTFYGQTMSVGDIYTVAGTGIAGFSGDDRPATGAKLYYPFGVAVDGAGDLLIADSGNNRIREVTG